VSYKFDSAGLTAKKSVTVTEIDARFMDGAPDLSGLEKELARWQRCAGDHSAKYCQTKTAEYSTKIRDERDTWTESNRKCNVHRGNSWRALSAIQYQPDAAQFVEDVIEDSDTISPELGARKIDHVDIIDGGNILRVGGANTTRLYKAE
jgi:hypothetical protein